MINVDEVIDSMIASAATPGKEGQVPKIADNIVQSKDENFQVQTSRSQARPSPKVADVINIHSS